VSGAPGTYTISYDPKAFKELAKLDRAVARRIVRAVDALAGDPRPSGSRPLVGFPDLLRLRVGAYRVIYTIRSDKVLVLVLRVAHRSEAYRNL
jgi:mRNA interferase RelE/StbE